MKQIILLIMVLFSSNLVIAGDCYEGLTNQYSKDSRHFAINIDDLDGESINDVAEESISQIYSELGCKTPKFVEVSCQQLGSARFSESCYVETNDGYFFVQPDMVQSVNIVFNRFD